MKFGMLAGACVLAINAMPAAAAPNPLLAPWTGPYGGEPAFDKVRIADFKPAIETAMAAELAEIDAITANKAAPTFDNTIVAMEKVGTALNRVGTYYFIWSGNLKSPEFQKVETEMSPKFAAIGDKITQNPALFARIDAVYNSPAKAKLTPEKQRLVWVYWQRFVEQGAKLSPAAKAEFAANNQKLASLYTKFEQNELADEESYVLTLDDKAQLAGLTRAQVDAAAAEGVKRKQPGKWLIANTRSAMEPFLTYADDRAAREKGFRMWTMRGDNGGATDNNAVVTQILHLRAANAKLIGYPTYAHWQIASKMAKTPDNALALELAAWKPAVAQVHQDVAVMQGVVDQQHGGFKIAPWDYRYYAEKVRKAKYDLDLNEVKPYLQLDHVREAMFFAAGKVYGFTFTEVHGLPVFHPEVTVWEVKGRDGKHVGLWYFDPYARDGKRSGAWMTGYRSQEHLRGYTPIVSNNSNFVKGEPGQPVLISWDDATTMYHEFGHALHGLLSDVKYPSQGGVTARDFVEFPSQIHEHWLSTPEVLSRFALHYKTGKPLPAALLKKIEAAENFSQGFDTMEYLASAMVDMRLHLAGNNGGKPIDPDKFERETLTALGMPAEIVMRHRTPQFGHVFSGEGYAAGYYVYLWADALAADAWEAFEEGKGPWDKAVAARFAKTILAAGDTKDQAEEFREFRGRDVDTAALMRDRGFAPPKKK